MIYYDDEEVRERRYSTYTATNTTTATNSTVTVYYSCTTTISNGVWRTTDEPERPQPDYVSILPVLWPRISGKAQMPIGRSPLAKLARGKLLRWKSLKEKRQSWGIA